MGKKGKKKRGEKSRAKKRARKASNRAKYDAWRAAGTNSKSFRQRKKAKKKGSGDKGKHLTHDCGNVGCLKCNPEERKPTKILSIRNSLVFIRKMFPIKIKKLQKGQKAA